jgi:hypothetical protein
MPILCTSMITAHFDRHDLVSQAVTFVVYLMGIVPLSLDASEFVLLDSISPVATLTYCGCVSAGCADMAGRGLDGVGKSSNSAFFKTNTRRDNAAKMISQLTSNPRSVQARIICVAVKVEVVTFMDTSSFIKSFQEKEKCIVCHYYSKTK